MQFQFSLLNEIMMFTKQFLFYKIKHLIQAMPLPNKGKCILAFILIIPYLFKYVIL